MNNRINEYVGITPIEFLKQKIGREITLTELLLLDYIIDTYKFEDGITNLFVEQVLNMNNNHLSRGFALKVANQWKECSFDSLTEALEYATEEFEKFIQLQRRDNFGEIRELTIKEKEIVNRIFYKSSLNDEILDTAISYCMKINDGYIISWFMNRLIEFLETHRVEERVEAEQLLRTFHEKYVLHFGLEKG